MEEDINNKIKRQTENTINYYRNKDNIEEVPIDILRSMYKDILAELEKKDKIIDLMAERISSDSCTEGFKDNIEQVKQYFYKKVEDM